ncbi:hypothetical protein [Kutzneria sp. CA-103260]|uniref:hypothetical protein n=1 Tax=Kutzneria sp. CA-103260 TaxID=2802641 RepID=UPI001BA84671|nr:hypothetical protein [Kutzneria sp. CA-103260]QUQ65332.1 hypothetical protein JJ691_30550 [Kutzneria sp. CA-103260]
MSLDVDPTSYWSPFYSHFPHLDRYLPRYESGPDAPTACVIGASDGKFVTPLTTRGWQVIAIELDPVFIDGGVVELRTGPQPITGLRPRLRETATEDRCRVVGEDYMLWRPETPCDLVISSGLWCMPQNRAYPLAELVGRQQSYVAPGGLFFADYLIATNAEERALGVCPEPEELAELFDAALWRVELNTDLGLIGESHLGWEDWHEHRYGAVIATRLPDDA